MGLLSVQVLILSAAQGSASTPAIGSRLHPDWVIGGHMHLRFSDGIWLTGDPSAEQGAHQVRIEVLDKIESGINDNLLVADLRDGEIIPI
jgi:hypothetical protein